MVTEDDDEDIVVALCEGISDAKLFAFAQPSFPKNRIDGLRCDVTVDSVTAIASGMAVVASTTCDDIEVEAEAATVGAVIVAVPSVSSSYNADPTSTVSSLLVFIYERMITNFQH